MQQAPNVYICVFYVPMCFPLQSSNGYIIIHVITNNYVHVMYIYQSGGVAGTAVDLTLHPLDTLKTRLQSSAGFWKSGGFRGVYSGILPAAAASAPSGKHCTGNRCRHVITLC